MYDMPCVMYILYLWQAIIIILFWISSVVKYDSPCDMYFLYLCRSDKPSSKNTILDIIRVYVWATVASFPSGGILSPSTTCASADAVRIRYALRMREVGAEPHTRCFIWNGFFESSIIFHWESMLTTNVTMLVCFGGKFKFLVPLVWLHASYFGKSPWNKRPFFTSLILHPQSQYLTALTWRLVTSFSLYLLWKVTPGS